MVHEIFGFIILYISIILVFSWIGSLIIAITEKNKKHFALYLVVPPIGSYAYYKTRYQHWGF
jgi:hypothetical protein